MNPDKNRFEQLQPPTDEQKELLKKMTSHLPCLLRPNGEPVPETWTKFQIGEEVVIKDYTFKVAYIGETAILFEPVGPIILGESLNE